MIIRPAISADLAPMIALERQAPTAAHWTEPQYRALFHPDPGRIALIAEEDSQARGFVVARSLGQDWEIENIVVALEARRRGAAAALIHAVLDLARAAAVQKVFLEARESNSGARALYEKCGFRPGGIRPRYYRDPVEDAVVYSIQLL